MTRPRASLVSLTSTPYYHCVARCVRRAFLCGQDAYSGRCYEHRKRWVVDRLGELAAVFAVDICAYAVMSNHYHVVLRLDPARVKDWSDQEVIERWRRLFGLPSMVAQHQRGEAVTAAELAAIQARIEAWRLRLADMSWFMRCLNEHLARRANAEDGCTGRFWEGRFKSQALLDEAALLTCMSYVDLNPIRAGLAPTPEDSDFTSIQARIRRWRRASGPLGDGASVRPESESIPLLELEEGAGQTGRGDPIGFSIEEYLMLVDWAGRTIRADKRGAIEPGLPAILGRLGIDTHCYVRYLGRQEHGFACAIGKVKSLRDAARDHGRRFFHGLSQAARLFPDSAGL